MLAAVVVVGIPSAWGFLPPKTKPLPDYDKRVQMAQQSAAIGAGQAATLGAAQETAIQTLEYEVPQVRVSRDHLLGTPRFVTSTHGFLTGPDGLGKGVSDSYLSAVPAGDSHRVIKAFLNEHSALFGQDAGALTNARVTRDYVTAHNGLHTTVWQQTLQDIPVFEGLLVGNVTRNGELVNISSHFVPDPASAAETGTPNRQSVVNNPPVSAATAIANAAADIGVAMNESALTLVKEPQGAERKQTVSSHDLLGPAWIHLVWLPMNQNSLRLCWEVILTARLPQPDRYQMVVDAETGDVLIRRSMTLDIAPATYNVYTSDSPSPFSPGWPDPSSDQPPTVEREMVTVDALDTDASPNGWINDGDNLTSGNNAAAYLDRNLDGLPDGPLPQATGTNRVFDYPLDLTQQPTTYQSASTVQLFYEANWYHDRLYQLGFTEAAGNYQNDNFGRGGVAGDPVLCLVQAGADVGLVDNSAFLPAPDGNSGYCLMFVFSGPTPMRDGSLDAEVVLHEMTHGLTTRLVGGGVGISALQTEGMGEGWSDFYSLCLLSQPTDDVNANYAEAGYVTFDLSGTGFDENYYYGIRRYPYTTDMSKNPLTFKDIDPLQASAHFGVPISSLFGGSDPSEVHNQGEVWCVTLREMWANLVTTWGWDAGNELALQLVTDSLKLMPANPDFLEARDAILQADQIDTGGENYVDIWTAFAKRGMGTGARSPQSDTTYGVVESFQLPPDVTPDGILEVSVVPPSSSVLFYGETVPISVRVRDAYAVTNATLTATASTGDSVTFLNDGVAPDARANDGTYTGVFNVPSNQTSVTITIAISAPDKQPATNVVTYLIFPPPPNDDFADAIKVPAAGADYISNNKRATIEPNEPLHAGDTDVAGSLWWNYTPTTDGSILVDTVGSDFRSVVAVYTNSVLSTANQAVVSSIGSAARKGAYVVIPGRSGVIYHIAVAGLNTNNLGTLRLTIAPGLEPDTNAPTVTINSPANGIIVETNRLFVSGSAVDALPNPSGIRDINISVSPLPNNGEVTTTVTPNSLLGPASTNWSSIVGLIPGVNSVRVSATDYAGNRSAPVEIQVTYRPIDPPNDFFANALPLTATPDVTSVNTLNATREPGEPNHAGVTGGKSVWWIYQPPGDGVLTLSTTNSTFDTLLALYTGATVSNLTPVAGNDDAYEGAAGGFSRIVQAVRSNVTYHIAVDGYEGAAGVVFLSYSFVPATIYHLSVGSTAGGSVNPGSNDVQSNASVVLSAVPQIGYRFDGWDGDVVSSDNPLTLVVTNNTSVTAHFRAVEISDGFESGNLAHLPWLSTNPAWFVQTNVVFSGQFAARSAVMSDIAGAFQTSSLILTTNFLAKPGSFEYRVSSEPSFSYLKFSVDNVELHRWSGEVDWASFTFPVTAGTHTLRWDYVKAPGAGSGMDAAFMDEVNLPIDSGIRILPTPAQLRVHIQSDGTFAIELRGQADKDYVLQTSTDLVNWQTVSTNTATGSFDSIQLPISADTHRFYRAVGYLQP